MYYVRIYIYIYNVRVCVCADEVFYAEVLFRTLSVRTLSESTHELLCHVDAKRQPHTLFFLD